MKTRIHQTRQTAVRANNKRGGFVRQTIIVVTALIIVGSGLVYYFSSDGGDMGESITLTHTIERGTFKHSILINGEVEGAESLELKCEVKSLDKSKIEILQVVDDRASVNKGDPLVWLDSSALDNAKLKQDIVVHDEKAKEIQAESQLEVAISKLIAYEPGKFEFDEQTGTFKIDEETGTFKLAKEKSTLDIEEQKGTFKLEEQAIESEIFIAEENYRRAAQYATFSERLAAKGYVTSLQLEGDRFAVDKAQNELNLAKTKLAVLRKFTKTEASDQLVADVKIFTAQLKSAQSSYKLASSRLKEIEDQLGKCIIYAPQDGKVVYANEPDNEFVVEAGAAVRERQVLLRMPTPGLMEIEADVNESRIALMKVGQRCTIETNDIRNKTVLEGEVIQVNENPEPRRWYSHIKEYETRIRIFDPPATIRPGYSVKVTVHIREIPDVIQIPLQAVIRRAGRFFCIVREPNGKWASREIASGPVNEKYAVVEKGLSEGEQVSLDPSKLASEVDLPEANENGSGKNGKGKKPGSRPGGPPK